MKISEVSVRERACDFIREFVDDLYSLRLLRYFGRHPYTRFSQFVIFHEESMGGSNSSIEKALRRLVDRSFVKEYVENGFLQYSLTGDETVASRVIELANLDWSEWQVLVNTCRLSGDSCRRYKTTTLKSVKNA